MTTRPLACALLALVAGCGSDPPVVVVSDLDGPLAGAHVVFHDPDGAPVAHQTTDADGRASADVDGGGMVTVLFADDGSRLRGTIVGVERGDELAMVVSRRHVTEVGTVRVTVAPFAGAAVYVFETACAAVYTASLAQPVAIEIRSNCLAADGTLPLLVTARDGEGGMMAVAAIPALPWIEPMNVVMPAWSAPSVITLAGSAAPAGTSALFGELAYDVNGAFLGGSEAHTALVPGQAASFALPYAPGLGELLQARLALVYGSDLEEPDGASMLVRRMTTPTDLALDLGADLLPRLPAPSIDPSVLGRPTATWPAVDIPAADGGGAYFVWNEGSGDLEDWTVVIPPDVGGRVQLPELPEDLATWAPTAAATFGRATVLFADADWLSSYRGLRETIGFALAQGDQRTIFPAADATLRVTIAGDL